MQEELYENSLDILGLSPDYAVEYKDSIVKKITELEQGYSLEGIDPQLAEDIRERRIFRRGFRKVWARERDIEYIENPLFIK